jgi:hypothetical protein
MSTHLFVKRGTSEFTNVPLYHTILGNFIAFIATAIQILLFIIQGCFNYTLRVFYQQYNHPNN